MMIKNTNENVNEAITEAETTVVTAGPTAMIVTGTKIWNFDTTYLSLLEVLKEFKKLNWKKSKGVSVVEILNIQQKVV